MPGQKRSVATVESILEAAARILETDGFGAYSTNAVAVRAGVSIGSLYQYFPGKDSIIRALINRSAEAFLADLQFVEPDLPPVVALELMLQVAVRHQLQRPGLARLLDLEEMRLPMDDAYQATVGESMRLFRGCLAATGWVRPAQMEVASNDLAAIVKGLVDAAGQRGETDEAGLFARVRQAVFGYLGQAGGAPASTPSDELSRRPRTGP